MSDGGSISVQVGNALGVQMLAGVKFHATHFSMCGNRYELSAVGIRDDEIRPTNSDGTEATPKPATSIPPGVSICHDVERRFTVAYKFSPDFRSAQCGIARCSKDDQFSRKTGRELAIKRLIDGGGHATVVSLPRKGGNACLPTNGAEWRAVEQSILLALGLLSE